jgi:tetratricopeptide (TPR) repeat protein
VRADVRWTYEVHEPMLPVLRLVNVPVRWTEVTVRHTGYTGMALRERKLQRDCKILETELAERPDDPFVLFNLGAIAVERQDWSTALGHLQHSLRGSAPTDSIVRKLFALIARCHQMLVDLPAALGACAEGQSFDADDTELLFRKAVLHRKAGQPAEAEACWRRTLTLKRPDLFSSVDQGIYDHLTLRNFTVLAEERGHQAEAWRLWRMVLAACPGDEEALSRGEAWQ